MFVDAAVDAVSTISEYPTSQSFVMYNPSGKMFERTTVLYTSTTMAISVVVEDK